MNTSLAIKYMPHSLYVYINIIIIYSIIIYFLIFFFAKAILNFIDERLEHQGLV